MAPDPALWREGFAQIVVLHDPAEVDLVRIRRVPPPVILRTDPSRRGRIAIQTPLTTADQAEPAAMQPTASAANTMPTACDRDTRSRRKTVARITVVTG